MINSNPIYRGSNPCIDAIEQNIIKDDQGKNVERSVPEKSGQMSNVAKLKTNVGKQKHKTMETDQQQWRKLNGQKILQSIEDEVRAAIVREKEMGNELKVCIGTDSQVKGKETEFATVIVFIRKGKGGFMYINNETSLRKMSIKERMLTEVAKSIDIAYALCKIFTVYNVDMEVHADINTNPNFKSNYALKEAMGYIMGMGFAFKAKPEAFASSSCANKIVH